MATYHNLELRGVEDNVGSVVANNALRKEGREDSKFGKSKKAPPITHCPPRLSVVGLPAAIFVSRQLLQKLPDLHP